MNCTRADLGFIVSKLSQFMSEPKVAHLNLAKNVVRYLKNTIDYCLTFSKSKNPLKLIGYCDSDWAASSDRRSVSGYSYQLCENGNLISWRSKKQNVVALSSCEAEYTAMSLAIQEGKFLSQILSDITSTD